MSTALLRICPRVLNRQAQRRGPSFKGSQQGWRRSSNDQTDDVKLNVQGSRFLAPGRTPITLWLNLCIPTSALGASKRMDINGAQQTTNHARGRAWTSTPECRQLLRVPGHLATRVCSTHWELIFEIDYIRHDTHSKQCALTESEATRYAREVSNPLGSNFYLLSPRQQTAKSSTTQISS